MAKLSGYRKLIKWIRVGDDFIKASTETRAESVVMTDGTTLADRNGISDNSIKEGVNTVAGLKGFYYKAVDKTSKIIYLTKEQCLSPVYDENNLEVEEDLTYSENAVGKVLSVCNNTKFENSLRITKVESGKIYYELVDENEDPFETLEQITNFSVDDFSVWCHDCYDEGNVDLGFGAHAEGDSTKATNRAAHSEGRDTHAYGQYSHAEGHQAKAYATGSHAEGLYTQADGEYQHVQGKYNILDTEGKYAHIVGNGTGTSSRSNAHTVDWEGNAEYAGDVIAKGCGGAEPISLVKTSTQLGGLTFVRITKTEYDALTLKDPNTLYIVTE